MTPTLDRAFLESAAVSVADAAEERQFHLDIGEDRCLVNAFLPTRSKGTGFVVCHSYGLELAWLRRTERSLTRALADDGYPVVAIDRRGFGDSTGSLADASLARQCEDVLSAASWLASEAGTTQLGLIGARFGAFLACAVAGNGGVDRLVLINPTLDGRAYFRQMVREMNIAAVALGLPNLPPPVRESIASLENTGSLDVLGQPIYQHLVTDVGAIDIGATLGGFAGHLLLFQISKRSATRDEVSALATAVRGAGGTCDIEVVREPAGVSFGGAGGAQVGDTHVQTMGPVEDALVAATTAWMAR